ncbi:NAD-dependent succinate-semialdehyde dehydrogenase [Thermobifida cellulosilytica]|uniref:Succinate-semialdehyde dehydrogenase n=1 Tax=Thermobifida cellulosilytica TB100 TaxID=665004 RepID=A0A147KLJ0_THECS|nr:NAD-dependent succinate-semialdehyde dehydrogenase [Thermobifida cellulosilytica]KUP97316.1 succinate-semialdehyde dehydrogenase [Thermobifida cellulosilytica TB100]KUP98109.1 succinate-semialdehyde dehydrogenase [Thermobifida cellulosilytica TB100]
MATTEREARVVERVPKQLCVGGHWRDARSGATFKVEDPATGSVLCEVADAGRADGLDALEAAAAAQPFWAGYPPRDRGEILRRAYELLVDRQDDLALLMTLEMGKPVGESKAEIAYAAEFFRWFSEEAVRIGGGYSVAPNGQSRLVVMRQPVGPSLLITPWNFPMAMGTRKIGPAVAAGCTVILKPAQQTPLSALALADVLQEAGLPDGVLSVLPTTDAGGLTGPLLGDGRLRKLSFTGSTPVGRALIKQSADQVLRTSMELGGNAPFIVFDDADLDAAVTGAMQAKMRNIGEACTAANRLYVQAGVAEEFTARLAERMAALRVGRGTEAGVDVGPLIDDKARGKVQELVDDAVTRGARVLLGGEAGDGPGYFYQPTVLADVPKDSEVSRTEIFGPVAPVISFRTEEEVLTEANNTEYGLVSYVFTENLGRALRMAENLESGMVGLNQGVVSNPAAPFGGVKQSGLGREGGSVGIDEYLEVKYVGIGGF